MEYTEEQYQRVLVRSADMKAAIDVIQHMSKKGIDSWTEFGKALDVLFQARDAYMQEQHHIVLEKYVNRTNNT